jgi:predicted Zn-dependent protease
VKEKAIQMWSALLATDATNPDLAQKVVQAFGRGGNAELAKPIILESVVNNPENAGLVRLKWLVLLSTGDWKGAISAGEALQRLEPASADSSFYLKLATAYRADSQPSKALEIISKGYGKYPDNSEIYLLYAQIIREEADQVLPRGVAKFPTAPGIQVLRAQTLKSEGKLDQALAATKKAVSLDPKLPRGSIALAQAYLDVSQPDSAVVALEQGLETGVDSVIIAQFALSRGNALYKAASASKRREDFQLAMKFLTLSDRVTPTPQAKFLVGASAFSVGQSAATDAPKTKSCELSKLAEDAFATAAVNLPAGEAIAPDAAKQYLDYVGQLKPFVENQIKAFCS